MEAAFILPTVLFIIIGLIYLGFYLHDRNKIQLVINESLINARNYVQNETDVITGTIDYTTLIGRNILYSLEVNFEDKETIIYNYISNKLRGRLFIAAPESVTINITHYNINIQVISFMEFPFLGIKKLFTSSGIKIVQTNKSEIHYTTEFIRIFDVFSGVLDQVEIINDTLKRLQNILEGG